MVCLCILICGLSAARAQAPILSEEEKITAAYIEVVRNKCDVKTTKAGDKFWMALRKRFGVKTIKVGVRKKPLPSGNVDHVSVYETTGLDKLRDAYRKQSKALRKKNCKTLYEEAQKLGIWQRYLPEVSFKNGKIEKPKKPPQYVVKVRGKIYAVINPDGYITYAKGRDSWWHKAVVQYKIITGDLEIFGKPSQQRAALRKRYQQDEVQLLAYGDILGRQCRLKMTPSARERYDAILMRSITHGEKSLNVFKKHYYRWRAADHNPLFYKLVSFGKGDSYRMRPGDGLHHLVNEVVNGIYQLPCDKIIARAKNNNIYAALYQ